MRKNAVRNHGSRCQSKMLKTLRLKNFKNFREAEFHLGAFSILIGENASGKSNVRDALRFLHGISREYALAEIIGGQYEHQWEGIRGGVPEIALRGSQTFALEAELCPEGGWPGWHYTIEVEPRFNGRYPRIVDERLYESKERIFNTAGNTKGHGLQVNIPASVAPNFSLQELDDRRPVITQVLDHLSDRADEKAQQIRNAVRGTLAQLGSMRFLDFSPTAMRIPSLPAQEVLGNRGENLSSVLMAICDDAKLKSALADWVSELTPMEAVDFRFPEFPDGKTLVTLVERNGQQVSAESASDGTLRLLGVLAAMLGPSPASFYLIEELENGLHPARVYLLLDLIERRAKEGKVQVMGTTHSPQLLRFLNEQSREDAWLLYRLEAEDTARAQRVMGIADIQEVLQSQDLARLHESGWFETTMEFAHHDEGESG